MRRSEVRAIGAESGEGSGGMFTSVLLGRCFRDGAGGGSHLFFLKGVGGVLRRRVKMRYLGKAEVV